MNELTSITGQHFAFAHGRLSVLIGNLLTRTDVDRFLGAPDFKTAKHMLDDLKFIEFSSGNETVDEVLSQALNRARSESERMVPRARRDLLNILWLQYDVPYLAFRIKELKGMTSDVASMSAFLHTAYPREAWEAALAGKTRADLPPEMLSVVHALVHAQNASPQDIDRALAKAEAKTSLRIARKSGDGLTVEYVRHTIDLMNVRIFQRGDARNFAEEFIPGGLLPLTAFTGDRVSYRKALIKTPYGFKMKSDLHGFDSDRFNRSSPPPEEWTNLEQAIAQTRLDDLRAMWNQTLGPGPVFAYMNTIIDQVNLLRAILIGKKAQFTPQDIKKILPPLVSASYYG